MFDAVTLDQLRTFIAEPVRLKDERVMFTHDLLGDWVLVGDGPTTASANQQRRQSPRWHEAIRLFGQRTLEEADNDIDQCDRGIAYRFIRSYGSQTYDQGFDGQVTLVLDALTRPTDLSGKCRKVPFEVRGEIRWLTVACALGNLTDRKVSRFQ